MSVRNNLRAVHARTRICCTVLFDPCDDLQCACILIVSLHHYRAYQTTSPFPLPLPTPCHKNPQPLYCSNVDYVPEFYAVVSLLLTPHIWTHILQIVWKVRSEKCSVLYAGIFGTGTGKRTEFSRRRRREIFRKKKPTAGSKSCRSGPFK